MTVILLGARCRCARATYPRTYASSVSVRLLGVAPDGGYRVSPASLDRKRLVSALFLAFIGRANGDL